MKSPLKDFGEIDEKRLSDDLSAVARAIASLADPKQINKLIDLVRSGNHEAFHDLFLLPLGIPRGFERPICFTTLAVIQALVSKFAVIKQWFWTAANPFGFAAGTLIGTTNSLNPADAEVERIYQALVAAGYASFSIRLELVSELLPIAKLQADCLRDVPKGLKRSRGSVVSRPRPR